MTKKFPYTLLFTLSLYTSIAVCTSLNATEMSNNAQWDFDHNLRFRQTQLADNYYQLEMFPSKQANFEQLATFLIRKSYRLCGNYHYKLEMIQGIEEFDDKRAMPNYIQPSLIAKVEC